MYCTEYVQTHTYYMYDTYVPPYIRSRQAEHDLSLARYIELQASIQSI